MYPSILTITYTGGNINQSIFHKEGRLVEFTRNYMLEMTIGCLSKSFRAGEALRRTNAIRPSRSTDHWAR